MTKLEFQIERLGSWWCRAQHRRVRWPVHGEYECATCYRRYAVPWAGNQEQAASSRNQRVSSDHHSVTIWAPARHDSQSGLTVF